MHYNWELVMTLNTIANSHDFNSKIHNESYAIFHKFLPFETIVVAMMFLLIFKITTPLSDYLHTKNLEYAQAWRLATTAQNVFKNARN